MQRSMVTWDDVLGGCLGAPARSCIQRVRRVIFGCADPSAGAAGSVMNLLQIPQWNHRCDIASGILQDECAAILQEFFRTKRKLKTGEP
jgi:tRNA(adenine34) deaminase